MVPVLLVVLAALPSHHSTSREVDLTPPHAQVQVDLNAIQERTRRFEAQQARHRASEQNLPAPGTTEALGAARVLCSEPPGFWARLLPGGADSAETLNACRSAAERTEQLSDTLTQSRDAGMRHFDAVAALLQASPHREELQARLERERALLKERSAEAEELAQRAATALRGGGDSLTDRLAWHLLPGRGGDASELLSRFEARMRSWSAPDQPVLGAELTYVQGGAEAGPMPTAQMTPAYLSLSSDPALDDASEGREVELSPELVAKAQELGTAKAAYDFVKNEARLAWYFGSLQGSTQTLRALRGNDADLSALLVALLRAQGTPARFVHGTVKLSVEQIAASMGLLTSDEVTQLDAAASGGAAFSLSPEKSAQVVQALNAAAIPYETVVRGGRVAEVQLARIWVEAYVDFAEYRGVGNGTVGRQWVALEPSLMGQAKAAATPPVLDALTSMGETPDSLTSAWLGAPTQQSMVEFVRGRVESYLSAHHSDIFYSQVQWTVAPRREELPLLPGSLPYEVVTVHGEYAFLPESLQQRVRLMAKDEAGLLFETTLPLHQLIGHRTVLTHVPATETDTELITTAGGLYAAPASLVEVRPVLRINGREVVAASRSVGLGTTYQWSLEVLLPGGGTRRIDNRVLAGNVVAIGAGAPVNKYQEAQAVDASDLDGPAPRFLYARAAAYANAWTEGEDELARLLQVIPVRQTANFVFVQNQLRVDEELGVRRRLEWKGLEVDADFRAMAPVELKPGRGAALLRLSGYEGSFQEARILTEGTGEPAVSSVSVLQQAAAQVPPIPILHLNPTDALTGLSATPEVLHDVADQLARGRQVLIPATPLTLEKWTGTGFIARDPATEEGGYFLSGQISGGQTIVAPESWTDAELAERLSHPDAPAATTDLTQVARIVKVEATNFQTGTVGKPLPRLLAVYVTSPEGIPVKGAPVTFETAAPSKPLFRNPKTPDAQPAEQLTVFTDSTGRASVTALPDTQIARWAILEQAQPFNQLLGLNVVSAYVDTPMGTVSLHEPFQFLARPDVVAQLKPLQTQFISDAGVELGVPLIITAMDQYGNALANQSVRWSSTPNTARFFDSRNEPELPRVQILGSDPALQVPVLDQQTTLEGQGTVGFIPGNEPGTYTITASSGSASTVFTVITADSGRYAFRLTASERANAHGIVGSSTPAPYFLELLRRANEDGTGDWVRVKGTEQDIKVARVHMYIVDEATGTVLSHETATPKDLGTGRMSALDRDDNVVFWPRYLVKNGSQLLRFTAEVMEADHPDVPKCCNESFKVEVDSREPVLAVQRLRADQSTADLNGCGALSEADGALRFAVTNPASYPLYARIVQEPVLSGETLVDPPPNNLPRDPVDGVSVLMLEHATTLLPLKLRAGTHGGQVRLELLAPEFPVSDRLRTKVGEISAELNFDTPSLAAPKGPLGAKLILAVRNFESAATPENPNDVVAPTATVKPIAVPAPLRFCPSESGRVWVYSGQSLLAAADVTTGQGAMLGLSAISADTPAPEQPAPGLLFVSVPPGDPVGQEVRIKFVRANALPSEPPQERKLELQTRITDTSVLPVGHTFVKDVSTVDGHLVRQVVDLEVPGRRPALQFSRSYTNRGDEPGALGRGWSHGYSGYVVSSEDSEKNVFRYMVVGGEGAGQVFECGSDQTACKAQQGFHGSFRGETVGSGTTAHRELLFRAQDGTEYRYGPERSTLEGVRHPLLSIRSPEGNEMAFEYGGPALDYELTRVWEPGNRRFLQLSYARPAGAPRLQLARVDLYENPAAPARLDVGAEGTPLGVCIGYRYNEKGNLESAGRYDGSCSSAAPLREERYGYVGGTDEELQANLVSWTDANGHTTQYEYYQKGDMLPGEEDFLRFGDKKERVRRVIEPMAPMSAVTEFTYRLVPRALPVFGQMTLTFETEVKGPRPEVPPTLYRMSPYGGMVDVERPLGPMESAHTSATWDRVHVRRDAEQDARGRRVTMKYDVLGRMVERRTELPALAASGAAGPTEPVKDTQGTVLDEAVEKWSYDPAFGAPVCQMDAEGRITVHTFDTDGKDPRTGVPVGTGLLLDSRLFSTVVSRDQAKSDATCAELASTLPHLPKDIVTHREYCNVHGGTCAPGAVTGDLTATVDGNGNRTAITAYDVYGNVHEHTVAVEASKTVKTTREYDARGRLLSESDTFGHKTLQEYDGLDRPTTVQRVNSKGVSPSVVQQREYYPGGQLHREYHPATGFERLYTLDELNRVTLVTESGGGLPSEKLETHYGYDEAGNRVTVIDRRGVETTTDYDFGDRPVRVSAKPAAGGPFLTQNGVEGIVGQQGVVATYGYDAAGNKAFETDIHGHRTDYGLDSLYRVVRVQSPSVPGPDLDAPPQRYESLARFDLVGNKTRSVDGNGHETAMTYDFANRLVSTVDPVGRADVREYDANGNPTLERWLTGSTEQRRRTSRYDGLNRPREVTETFQSMDGATLTYVTQTAYDDANNTVTEKDARGFLTVVRKDNLDRVYQQTVDAATDPSGVLTRQPDDPSLDTALELTTSSEYDNHGNLAAQVDALGRRTEETHDALGRLLERRKPMGVKELFVYDGEGHTLQQTDGRGLVRTTGYDVAGRPVLEQLVESLSNNGATLTTLQRFHVDEPDATGLVTESEQDALNHQTVHKLDGLHREVRVEDALNHVRESHFDAQNLRVASDAKGQTTRYEYDEAGRLKTQQDFEANQSTARYTQTTTYDDVSRQVTLVDRRGIPTVRLQDGLGRQVRETRGADDAIRTESTTYNAAGQVVARLNPNNHTSTYRYDAAGRLQEETQGADTPQAAHTQHSYDVVGNRVSTLGPRDPGKPYTTRWTYDDLNRQVRSEDALEHVTVSAYDATGNLLCVKRPLGNPTLAHGAAAGLSVAALQAQACTGTHVTRYAYDEVGKLTDVIDALEGHYSFVYDATRNLVAKQDANGNLSTFEYDALGHRIHEYVHLDKHPRLTAADRNTVPLFEPGAETLGEVGTLTWQSNYDDNGNLHTFTDAKGQITTSDYGLLDRLETRTYSNHALPRELPSVESESFTYDENGNLKSVTQTKLTDDGTVQQTTKHEYDKLDRLWSTTLPSSKTLTFTYDAAGQRKSVTDPDGIATRYEYDGLGRLSEAKIPEGSSFLTTLFDYWPDSLPKSTQLPNGLTEKRCYDAAGQLTHIVLVRGTVSEDCTPTGTLLSRFAYTYDSNGNRQSQMETRTQPATGALGSPETTTYGYDALDRLTGVSYADGRAVLYRLDAVGNRTGEREAPASAVTSLGPEDFDSLPAGQLSRDTTGTFNRADWLMHLDDPLDSSRARQLGYDANGNLSSLVSSTRARSFSWDIRNTLTTVRDNNQEAGRYDYDANLQRTWRRTAAENVEYVLDESFVLQEQDAARQTKRRYHYAQKALAVSDSLDTSTHFLGTDGLGSVSDATSATGKVTATRKYDPWGNHQGGTAPEAGNFKLDFTGHQFDPETGLTYARARYYDSELGRFINRDLYEGTLTNAPSLHRYAYAHANPLRYTDPDGHQTVEPPTSTPLSPPTGPSSFEKPFAPWEQWTKYDPTPYTNPTAPAEPPVISWRWVLSPGTLFLGVLLYTPYQDCSPECGSRPRDHLPPHSGGPPSTEAGESLNAPGITEQPMYAPSSGGSNEEWKTPGLGGGMAYTPGDTGEALVTPGVNNENDTFRANNRNRTLEKEQAPVPAPRTKGDKLFETERGARREAFRSYNVPTSQANNFYRRKEYGSNPNLRGSKGEPYYTIVTQDVDGNQVEIEHHSNGHFFEDVEPNQIAPPHYHGPQGQHFDHDEKEEPPSHPRLPAK